MRIAVLGNAGSWYLDDLARAAVDRGHDCRLVRFPRLSAHVGDAGESLGDAAGDLQGIDAAVIRTMPPGSLEQVVFRMDALSRLEAAGVTVLNPPRGIECAVDKYLTTARLQAAGVPVPETVVCEGSVEAMNAFEQLGGDVVVKPVFGSEGRGIVRVDDGELALRTFRTLERLQSVLYLQRFVDHGGYDDRVLLLDGEVLGGMRRWAREDFRTNISQQGQPEAWQPDADDLALARTAAAATGVILAGVDLISDPDGRRLVLEVNAVPGWRALGRVNDLDVADRIVAWLAAQVTA